MRAVAPASVAICFALATRIGYADDAPRRQVAVIDLSADDAVMALSQHIYRALTNSDDLRVLDRRELDIYLIGPLLDEDGSHLQSARDHLGRADNQLFTNYDAKAAATEAGEGEQDLQAVVPTDEVRTLYAQLSLVLGLALLDQQDSAGAARAFALTHRLDPTAQLDPARYPPDITAAFARAAVAASGTAPLAVLGTGRVWIDGRDRGIAPGTFPVELGDHVVVLVGQARETSGLGVRVAGPSQVEIPDTPASLGLQVARARLVLSRAAARGDDAARAGAMRELASRLGVGAAVLISKRADGKLQWETWQDRAPGFSPPRLYTSQKPEALLEGLAPPRPPRPVIEPAEPLRPLPPEPERAWYRRGWVQASVIVGVAAIVAGAVLIARHERDIGFDGNVMTAGGP